MRLGLVRLLYVMHRHLGRRGAAAFSRKLGAKRKWHLVPHLSPAGFLAKLTQRRIRHVVLRPATEASGLELLVADEHLPQLDDCITRWPVGDPIRVYSVGGRPGYSFWARKPSGSFQSMALLPPQLGAGLIARAISGQDRAKTLTPDDAFRLLAYRSAYLEEESWEQGQGVSGWRMTRGREAELRRLAASAGRAWDGPVSPADLDQLLAREGWQPPHDLLERAASWMSWISETLPGADPEADLPGVSLFFVRERAARAGLKTMLLDSLQDSGFEPLLVAELDSAQSEQATIMLRGGNWGSGPFQLSGGPPAVIAVTLDLLPLAPSAKDCAAHPGLDNAKIVLAKTAARNLVNAALPKAERYNALHSTDNSTQAWRIIRQLLGSHEPALRETIERMQREFATDGAIEVLTRHGRRAKVELIEFEGRPAIRKTFKSTALRFMEREIEAMEALALVRPEIPRLLARTYNSIIIEHVGRGEHLPRIRGTKPSPLPLAQVRQIAEFIKASVAHGFDPLDLRAPGNMIFMETGLKIIDFELWRRCDPETPAERCFGLSGVPMGDTERPRGIAFISRAYQNAWYPHTLLSVESFLHDPAWLQQVKRNANFAVLYCKWCVRALARGAARKSVALMHRQNRSRELEAPERAPRSPQAQPVLTPLVDKPHRSDVAPIEVGSPSTV